MAHTRAPVPSIRDSPPASRPLPPRVDADESGQRYAAGAAAPDASNHYSLFDNNDAGGECGVVTAHVVPLPGDATPDAPWWAWATGPFFLITLSSEHDFTTGSAQHAWLAATLASVNRSATPFLFVGIHRPMYIDSIYVMDTPYQRGRGPSSADIPVMTALQAHVEPLTMRHKVTLLTYGHNHAVQILTPAYNNASVQASVRGARADGAATRLFARPRASLHMVIGTGGAGFTPNCATAPGVVGVAPPDFDERCFYAWGFLVVKAVNATTLELDWVDGSTREVIERVDLVQDLDAPWADAGVAAADVAALSPAVIAGAVAGALAAAALGAFVWSRGGRARAWKTRAQPAYAPVAEGEGIGIPLNPMRAGA